MSPLFGLSVVSHPLAERAVKKARIERTAVKKRRRGWKLTYETKREPCVFQAGNTIYMHPKLYQALVDEAYARKDTPND
jgi:hypothetical protein